MTRIRQSSSCMGTFDVLPTEVRRQIWRYTWKNASNAEWMGYRGRKDWRWYAANKQDLSILRSCWAIYCEALYEMYNLSDLNLRMHSIHGIWMVKDIRKLTETYARYIPFDSFDVPFPRIEYSGFSTITIEIPPPLQSGPAEIMRLRRLAKDRDVVHLLSCSTKYRTRVQFVLLNSDESSWLGVQQYKPRDSETLTVPDVEAVLLSFCSIRNLSDVEIILPEGIKDDGRALDFILQMKQDLESDRTRWLADRSELAAEAESTYMLDKPWSFNPYYRNLYDLGTITWTLEPSLKHREIELSLYLQIVLDFLPGRGASLRRKEMFEDLEKASDFLLDDETRAILKGSNLDAFDRNADYDPEIAHGIFERIDRSDVSEATFNREKAARIWFGLAVPTRQDHLPPLDLRSNEWRRLFDFAVDNIRLERVSFVKFYSDHFLTCYSRYGIDGSVDEEDIRKELSEDPSLGL